MAVAASKTVSADQVMLVSPRGFSEVRDAVRAKFPPLDPAIADDLAAGRRARVADFIEKGPPLSIFLERDHGALLQSFNGRRNAIQFEIGNPTTAARITSHCLAAGVYAPLRIMLFEDRQGRTVVLYNRPSSLFGQFGDENVNAIARELDAHLESGLHEAAGV